MPSCNKNTSQSVQLDVEKTIRINKALSGAGICSRRRADELIIKGLVKINGRMVEAPGVQITPSKDIVEVEGRIITFVPEQTKKHEYLIMNKPALCLSTMKDPQQRRTVMDMLPASLREKRPFPVGRLDCMSEGLLLLTTDGELAYRLTHPKWHVEKIYRLILPETVEKDKLDIMRRGMTLKEGESVAGIKVKIIKKFDCETELELTLRQGINRQIRRMCRDLGLKISRLVRTRIGPLSLDDLPEGQWRPLSDPEIAAIKKYVGLK